MTRPDEGIDLSTIDDIQRRLTDLESHTQYVTTRLIETINSLNEAIDEINYLEETVMQIIKHSFLTKVVVPRATCDFVPAEPTEDE